MANSPILLSLNALVAAATSNASRPALSSRTFVGIDFGTSTTVVSLAQMNAETGEITVERLLIPQEMPDGRMLEHTLVPSAIAWTGQKLLIGAGALELRFRPPSS